MWTAIAALGAAALTGLASLGVVAFQGRQRKRSADEETLHGAIATLLARSAALMLKAGTMRIAAAQRSGLGEGLDIALHIRKPLDHFEFHDWIGAEWSPLNEAWAEIWLRGDQEAIALANDVVSASADVLNIGVLDVGRTRSVVRRMGEWIFGQRTGDGGFQKRVRALADARRRLGDYTRLKFGKDAVSLFVSHSGRDIVESSDAKDSGAEVIRTESVDPRTTLSESETESEIIALLVGETRSQIALQAANADSHDSKALAFLGAAVAGAIAMITLHDLASTAMQSSGTLIGKYWWLPVVGFGIAIVAFAFAVANREFTLGPAPDVFYEEHIRDPLLTARLGLLSDLNYALTGNERPLRWKRWSVLTGEVFLALSVALMVTLGIVLH